MIHVVTIPSCPWCTRTKALLTMHGLEYGETEITHPDSKAAFAKVHNVKTFPQVFSGDTCIGGFEDTQRWIAAGGHLT